MESHEPHSAIKKYANLPFMRKKNEGQDRQNILMLSKEFNPLIRFSVVKNSNKSEKLNKKSPVVTPKAKVIALK